MVLWVWCKSPTAQLVYLGIATEADGATTLPKVSVKNLTDFTTLEREIPSASHEYDFSRGRSDIPYIHSKLSYGLSKVVYFSADGAVNFTGGFKVVDSPNIIRSNCLAETGPLYGNFPDATGNYITLPSESTGLANVATAWEGGTAVIQFKAVIPKGCGVVMLTTQGYDGSQVTVDNNRQSSVLLFREDTDIIRLYLIHTDVDEVVNFIPVGAPTSVLTWPADNTFNGRIEVRKDAGSQKIDLISEVVGGGLIHTFTPASKEEVPYAGVCGGLFANTDFNPGVDKTVELNEMFVIRD
jgi:hypothetical protein